MFARLYRPPAASYFLFGPRGTGKSMWLRARYADALWIDLNDPESTRFYGAAPERLRASITANPSRRPIVIDEVQRVPELLPVVHQLIELDKSLVFVLTGSTGLSGSDADPAVSRTTRHGARHPLPAVRRVSARSHAGPLVLGSDLRRLSCL